MLTSFPCGTGSNRNNSSTSPHPLVPLPHHRLRSAVSQPTTLLVGGARNGSDTGTVTVMVQFKLGEVARLRSTNYCDAVSFSRCYSGWKSAHASRPHHNDSTGAFTSHEGASDLDAAESSQTVKRPAELKGSYTIKKARLVSTRRARHPVSFSSPTGYYQGRCFASIPDSKGTVCCSDTTAVPPIATSTLIVAQSILSFLVVISVPR